MRSGLAPSANACVIRFDDQFCPDGGNKVVAELNHFMELIARIDVQQGERDFAGKERLLGQPDHNRRVLADGIQHHRVLKFGGDFANDLNALGFEQVQMVHRFSGELPAYTINLIGIEDKQKDGMIRTSRGEIYRTRKSAGCLVRAGDRRRIRANGKRSECRSACRNRAFSCEGSEA